VIAWVVLIVTVVLFAYTFFCFLRLFIAQVRLITVMMSAHELDDSDCSGPAGSAGLKQSNEITSFFHRTDPTALQVRSKWLRAFGRLVLSGAVLLVWLGVMYGLLEIEDATSGQKFVIDGKLQ